MDRRPARVATNSPVLQVVNDGSMIPSFAISGIDPDIFCAQIASNWAVRGRANITRVLHRFQLSVFSCIALNPECRMQVIHIWIGTRRITCWLLHSSFRPELHRCSYWLAARHTRLRVNPMLISRYPVRHQEHSGQIR